MNKKQTKSNFKKRRKLNPKFILIVKSIFIIFIIFGLYYNNQSFSNKISLLAVSENSKGDITTGSIIDLKLKIKPGNGQIFVNLKSIEEVDTQISIINSQKIACELFNLNCQEYDFFYEFDGSALVLKGPSASTAIAIITAKTINKQKINDKTVITGALNSGGLIGNVGGVDQKIKVAQDKGFKKVLIPIFSEYTLNETKIEVIKVLDIVEAYNQFNGDKYELQTPPLNKTNYEILMKKLANLMCERTYELNNQINEDNIKINTSEEIYFKQAKKSLNSSQITYENKDYYSSGSFCFNANINYRNVIEIENNLTLNQIEENIKTLKKELDLKYLKINSEDYKQKIKTINDFYSYLIINDRVNEAREIIKDINKLKFKENKNISNNNNNTENKSISIINQTLKTIQLNNIKSQKNNAYSYAKERAFTANLWEKFISNSGTKIKFNDNTIDDACFKINKEIQIKSQLINKYGLNYLDEEINEQLKYQNQFSNKYLCIYKGLELNGKINTILNSAGINNNQSKEYTKKIIDFTNSRIALNSNGNFPLIPFIYAEYAKNLIDEENFGSSMLYSNYALSYLDLNLLLEKEDIKKSYFNVVMNNLFENYVFIGSMLILIGFIS